MKIIHISDLHFGKHQKKIADVFVRDALEIDPDVILISGDLTHRAKPDQFILAQQFLKKLPGNILVVPGNHDIPLHNIWARTFFPYKNYKEYINTSLELDFEAENIHIMGLNTVNPQRLKSGKLSSQSLEKIKKGFNFQEEKIKILFFHHNFDYVEDLHKPLQNDKQFLNYLKESPIHIVCTGHLHFANVNLIEKSDKKPCLILHTGSLLCERTKDGMHSYFLIEVKNDICTVFWYVFKNHHFSVEKIYTITLNKKQAELEIMQG